MGERRKGFVLIGRVDGNYYFADSVFEHEHDGFRGVTGSVVRPVFADEYEWASDPENVAERYQDIWGYTFESAADTCCENCFGEPDPDTGCDECNIPSLDRWVSDIIRFDGIENAMFDPSYVCDASPVFERLGIKHECTDCSGGGRIFTNGVDFDRLHNPDAYAAILKYEEGSLSFDNAARGIFSSSYDLEDNDDEGC